MKFKSKLFKNDPFGVKTIYFRFLLERSMRKGIKIQMKIMKICLNEINRIGIPFDEEEKKTLRKAVKKYDEAIEEIERSLEHARRYFREKAGDGMEELEKCPFCGGGSFLNDFGTLEPEFEKTGAHIGTYRQIGDLFWGECRECGSTGSEKESPEEAIEAWNRRCCG